MKLNVQRADPAGNITLFVLDPVPREERRAVAARLMAQSDAEQVGFVCPPLYGTQGRMEMAGGEFCGNATRAFGMIIAQERGYSGQVLVEVSGCDHPVTVEIDWSAHTARAQMPLPRSVSPAAADGCPGTLVDLTGIAHFVVEHIPPSLDFFEKAEPLLRNMPNLEAYGVMFLNGASLTPLVKVPSTGSLMWEGSCGSGSLAAAVAQSRTILNGPFLRSYIQPAGVIQVEVTRRKGTVDSAWIGGTVTLDSPALIVL